MKKIILLIILVLSLAGAAIAYYSYPSYPDTPPSLYAITSIHHGGATTPTNKYYLDGSQRTYISDGYNTTGSRLMDPKGKLLEENVYKHATQNGREVLAVAHTKYFTFWGRYHRIVAFTFLLFAVVALTILILTFGKQHRVGKA